MTKMIILIFTLVLGACGMKVYNEKNPKELTPSHEILTELSDVFYMYQATAYYLERTDMQKAIIGQTLLNRGLNQLRSTMMLANSKVLSVTLESFSQQSTLHQRLVKEIELKNKHIQPRIDPMNKIEIPKKYTEQIEQLAVLTKN